MFGAFLGTVAGATLEPIIRPILNKYISPQINKVNDLLKDGLKNIGAKTKRDEEFEIGTTEGRSGYGTGRFNLDENNYFFRDKEIEKEIEEIINKVEGKPLMRNIHESDMNRNSLLGRVAELLQIEINPNSKQLKKDKVIDNGLARA